MSLYLDKFLIFLFILNVTSVTGTSYHQPKLCPNASWNPNAVTIMDSSIIGLTSCSFFINKNDTIFLSSAYYNNILIWLNGKANNTLTINFFYLSSTHSLFVTIDDQIMVYNGYWFFQVDQYLLNGTQVLPSITFDDDCYGLFVSVNNDLYCSLKFLNKVVRKSLINTTNAAILVAGNGSSGSTSNMLDEPMGILVTNHLDLYVADSLNNRIQLFRWNQSNGTTIAGTGASGTIALNHPSDVSLDANGYVFIIDMNNHRVIGSDPYGFRCIAGCTGTSGSASNKLLNPVSLSFDSLGNLYVLDDGNTRIQKFSLLNNSCNMATTTSSSSSSASTTTTSTSSSSSMSTTTSSSSSMSTTTSSSSSSASTTTSTSSISTTTTTVTVTTTTTSNSSTSLIVAPASTDAWTSMQQPTTLPISIINQSCYAPIITLIPSTSTFSSPLQFRRSQDFYLSSTFYIRCNQSSSLSIKWSIFNCTSLSCSHAIQLDPSILTTFNELYLPSRTLPFGIYELKLKVTMAVSTVLSSSVSAYVRITPSGITANLVPLGTSMITSGHSKDLQFDPGRYSIDLDGYPFNATDWTYNYYCRIYGVSNFPHVAGVLLSIDDHRLNQSNASCFTYQSTWQYNGASPSSKSSLLIHGESLQSNRTYQFMVYMENKRNSSLQATGYVLVRIEDTRPQMVAIGCIISTLCAPNLEYQFVNPTTQVALFSFCVGDCSTIQNITWNIYFGHNNGSSSNFTRWTLFSRMHMYQDIWFFGRNTTNFTSTNQLFLANPQIELWKFEVTYSFSNETSSSALNFIINQPPSNGSCSISPINGTTTTLFTISCPDWFDQDAIKDYSLYSRSNESITSILIAFSSISTFSVYLPPGSTPSHTLQLFVAIRDTMNCIAQINLTSVLVQSDTDTLQQLINDVRASTNNPLLSLLSSGNQNSVGQVLASVSYQVNQINTQLIDQTVSQGVPASTISVSSLTTPASNNSTASSSSSSMNQSALDQLSQDLSRFADLHEYLISFTEQLSITTANSIQIQASALAQLTRSTNQLTRATITSAIDRCHRLATALNAMATRIPFEDVQLITHHLLQCATHLFTATNAPLQGRTIVLDKDFTRATSFPADYETDLESPWSNLNLFADGDDFSSATIDRNRNLFYQKQLAHDISDKVNQIKSLLSQALHVHLNLGQSLTIDTPTSFMSTETLSRKSLSMKEFAPISGASIRFPSAVNISSTSNTSLSLRSTVEPLASFGEAKVSFINTNLSRSISLTLLDQQGNVLPTSTTSDHPFEFIIPHDPQLIVPSMHLQHVTNISSSTHQLIFNLHFVNITVDRGRSVAIHFDLQPIDGNLSYLLIYRFDQSPILNSSVQQIDGWTSFCASNRTDGSVFHHFMDDVETAGHKSVVFGVRELNVSEVISWCMHQSQVDPPMTDARMMFRENYRIRVYTSSCLYFDEKSYEWKWDGLRVGPLSNIYQTHCYSTHLT